MLALLAALLLPPAWAAAPHVQELTWDLSADGTVIGHRTVTLKTRQTDEGSRRVLESWTELDGRLGPLPVSYQERLTAFIEHEPASFLSVQSTNGNTREVQARRVPLGWKVAITQDQRVRSYDLAANRIDLSTVDLFDPESRVPLSRFESVKVLSAESGVILEGTVESLGPSSIDLGDVSVPVQGYRFHHPDGEGSFFYTSDGILVRYEMQVLGYGMEAQLRDPPPAGPDDAPLVDLSDGIEATEL